jgi:HprK-related kinase A
MPLQSQTALRIHGWRADVAGPAGLLRELEALFPTGRQALFETAPVEASATFEVVLDAPQPGWQRILRDGAPLWTGQDADELLAYLEWGINRTAAEWLGQRYLLFHAGSVARDGRGLILPAASGSGKTTLVAGLLAAGFEYLSDEVAVVDPHQLNLLPFAKSLCVKAGGREVLAGLSPGLATAIPRRRFGGEPVWYLPPSRETTPNASVAVRHVVLPRYRLGGVTELRPVARSAALRQLLEQSFNLRAHGAWGVGRLVDMLRQADCYTLSVGELQPAVELLVQLTSAI